MSDLFLLTRSAVWPDQTLFPTGYCIRTAECRQASFIHVRHRCLPFYISNCTGSVMLRCIRG